MIETLPELIEVVNAIDPAQLDYQSWLSVGMALKDAGASMAVWDEWSARDTDRYHGIMEIVRKWDSFQGSNTPVSAGSLVQMAQKQGAVLPRAAGNQAGTALDWDSTIGQSDPLRIIDAAWVEAEELTEPTEWDPVHQLVTYLETLFEAAESVGYVTESWQKDGKYIPTKGHYDRTSGELIQQLNGCGGDIGSVLGDYKPEVGAWIRFNPLDGKGVKNENVTEYRYALVESDDMPVDQQNAILRKLELPIACLTHSGGKSLHAIVRIDALNYDEYRKRVDYLYNVCKKNGLEVDTQNKNPSRLSRMPGVMRNGHKQWLVDTNIGKASWNEWHDWIEGVNDDLPEPETMANVWDNLPDLSPALIDGVLRQGHKMLLAGPSKAGKSYMLISLCIAIAEGRQWLGWNCAQGRVLYVNLELDRASCLHRFRDVYEALQWPTDGLHNIDIWNLRGKAVPMDKLAPKLIRRAIKREYLAVIIDPIYKVITGDENSADQMAHFTNQFDKICTELGSAVIYCHHHSKGYQGQKRSMDRASGSGVFARDPDALLDLTELELTRPLIKQLEDRACCQACVNAIQTHEPLYLEDQIGEDEKLSASQMMKHAKSALTTTQYNQLKLDVEAAQKAALLRSAWRVEGTLREYPRFEAVNLWFDYPIHRADESGQLKDLEPEGEKPPHQRAMDARKDPEAKKRERKMALETAWEACAMDGKEVTTTNLAEYMGVSNRTVKNYTKEHGDFMIVNNGIGADSTVVRKRKEQ
ncbi:MAG: AAA family ATPase [Christensenellales bacterium]|jgi:RecA-family ATPase